MQEGFPCCAVRDMHHRIRIGEKYKNAYLFICKAYVSESIYKQTLYSKNQVLTSIYMGENREEIIALLFCKFYDIETTIFKKGRWQCECRKIPKL
jgi:hypothetical protein